MNALSVAAALGVAGTLVAAPARAEPEARADPEVHDLVARPVVLGAGALELQLTASINVQLRSIGMPMSLAPDLWWGITPRVTVGIIHSDTSLDQIATSASLCVREAMYSPCDRLYHGGGLDVRVAVLSGQFALAPRARVLIRDLDPFKPAVTLGALMRWTHGRFAIVSDPYLRLPLANHDLGNRAAMMLPVWFAVQPAAGWQLALRTGWSGDLVVLRDGGHGMFALEATSRITADIDLGLVAGWGSLFGPQHDPKHGTVMIVAGWHG